MPWLFVRKAINYTVYPPRFDSDRDACWDVRTVKRARLLAKQLGVGSRLRRNINLTNKTPLPEDWWVERVWEWDGVSFRDITKNTSKGLP
jgi:hypothetical protein